MLGMNCPERNLHETCRQGVHSRETLLRHVPWGNTVRDFPIKGHAPYARGGLVRTEGWH